VEVAWLRWSREEAQGCREEAWLLSRPKSLDSISSVRFSSPRSFPSARADQIFPSSSRSRYRQEGRARPDSYGSCHSMQRRRRDGTQDRVPSVATSSPLRCFERRRRFGSALRKGRGENGLRLGCRGDDRQQVAGLRVGRGRKFSWEFR
jgi:hypothetical protein